MATDFFNDDQNLAELVGNMAEEDQCRFRRYGHLRVEAAFLDRKFIVYKPTGLTPSGAHKEPEILTTIKIVDFGAGIRSGCHVLIEDMKTNQQLRLDHVPRKLFGYVARGIIFVPLPTLSDSITKKSAEDHPPYEGSRYTPPSSR